MISDSPLCPCNSGLTLQSCCQPLHQGQRSAPTAVALMRSRFSAYATQQFSYLHHTWAQSSQTPSLQELSQSSNRTEWVGLVIHSTELGKEKDIEGWVTFSAYFRELTPNHTPSCLKSMTERSYFQKIPSEEQATESRWVYVDGQTQEKTPALGRNSPCVCGSGRKFKQCCL